LNDLKETVGMETTQLEEVEVMEKPMERETPVVPAEKEEEALTPEALAPPPLEKAGENEEAMNKLRDKLNEMYDENTAQLHFNLS